MQINITENHLFLGYKPLIIGIPAAPDDLEMIKALSVSIKLTFTSPAHGKVAELLLLPAGTQQVEQSTLYIFQGTKGKHSFIHPIHKLNNSLRNLLKKSRPGNVGLQGNLYDQVRIAYAVPRKIRIISTGQESLYNMFPTDLHGQLGQEDYVISLRWEGKACKQVEETGKIVLSAVNPQFYQKAYALGKNHMQELRPVEAFPASPQRSQTFGLPLPEAVTQYFEMELIGKETAGIHQLNYFRIIKHVKINKAETELTHIHAYYANWRMRNGMKTDVN